MKPSPERLTKLFTGSLTSVIFGTLLVFQIMEGGVGESISFDEFLDTPANLLFCLLITVFILSAWLMKGVNNRVVLFCWAVMVTLHSVVFYNTYSFFLFELKNIYALCIVGLLSSIPIVIIMRYRVLITVRVGELLWKTGFFRQSLGRYLRCAGSTDFEFDMRLALYGGFVVEFLYSLYMLSYGLFNQLPYRGNITEHMQIHQHWMPYPLYFLMLEIVTVLYILIMMFHIYRDVKYPDAFGYGISEQDRRAAGLRLLEQSRKKAKKKKNKHD